MSCIIEGERMMGRWSAFLFLIIFAATPFVNASITEDWWCTDDGDGVIVMDNDLTSLTETAPGEYDLSTTCVQDYFLPGHIIGEFPLDAPGDPTVWFINEITNETDFDWTDYHVAIGMAQEFSILTTGLMMPNGWYADITPAADGLPLPGDEYHGDGWVGYIDYYQDSGDPVLIGDPATFGFKISFDESVAFCAEMVPTPEPTTIALLGLGAISVLRRRRK